MILVCFIDTNVSYVSLCSMFFLSVLEPLSAEKNSTILEYFSKEESKSTENKSFPATTDDFSDVPDDFFDDVMEDTQWEPPPKKMKMPDS